MSNQHRPSPAETYEAFLVPGIHARWAPALLEHAAPEPGERALDLACGTGIVARNVAPRVGEDGAVVAVDIRPDMLAVARDLPEPTGPAVEWRQADAAALPLPDDAFDVALCQQGFQFFADRPAASREMRRVLAPGGRAALSVFRGLDHHPLYAAILEAEAHHLGRPVEELAVPFSLSDADELREPLDDAGFERVAIEEASRTVAFPSPDRFVQLTVLAGAAILPDAELDERARSELVEAVDREVADVLAAHVEEDAVVFPMHAHIAVAHA